jgi:ABC-2 type transport system ATP-binding protein
MELESEIIIDAQGLVKRFGSLTAVDHLDITVKKGEVYGFLGPNGAGKTTTVRMLTTVDLPDEGNISIDGYDTKTRFIDARRNIGMIQQHNSLDKDISVRENIFHHALMQNLSIKESKRRMEEMCSLMELDDYMDKVVAKLSGGWKKKVAIICSMIHEPDILFMDEPTTGLDTQSRNMLWKMIRKINARGTTVFLTTHYIFEADSLCDRVGIINKGKMIAEGTPEELKARVGRITMVVTDSQGNETQTYYDDREAAKKASLEVGGDCNISIRETNLEDVFLELTGGKI